MSQVAEPIAVTLLIAEIFDALGVPYFVGGSLASSFREFDSCTPRQLVFLALVAR